MENIKNTNLIPPSPEIDINTLKPFTRFCCSIGTIPASYLVAMSYEEQLLWLCDFLENTVIPTVNNNAEAVAELQALFIQLKDYVDNYFKDLDVQDEINNKLDQMVEDGTLQSIIFQYMGYPIRVFNTVQDLISSKLINEGDFCKTLGYNSINDGGGAYYLIVNSSKELNYEIKINDNIKAELFPQKTMFTAQFNCGGNLENNQDNFQNAINYCIENNCNLSINNDINITTLKTDLIEIIGNINIFGNNHNINNNTIGDYHSLFQITGIVNISDLVVNNNRANAPTSQTGTDNLDRVDFYFRDCSNCNIKNITINDCIGVWQFIFVRGNNCKLLNNIINYNELYDLSYDRTSIYLNGFNLTCSHNILNGKMKARTGIESHGDNIEISYNEIKQYRNSIYAVNDYTSNNDKIHNVSILNNYCYTERGCAIWLGGTSNVDTFNILNNTFITYGDYYAFYVQDVLGQNLTINNINIINNIIKQLSSSLETIRISPSRIGDEKNVSIQNINLSNNFINGITSNQYMFNLVANLDGFSIDTILLKNNTCNLNNNLLFHYVSPNGDLKNLFILNNIINNNGDYMGSIALSSSSGFIKLINNIIEKDLLNIVSGNGNINTYAIGDFPVDLKTTSILVYFANLCDKNNNTCKTKNGKNNFIIFNDTTLEGSNFKLGDIIINNNPVIGTPFGWVSIGNDNFRIIQNILGGT